MQDISMGTINGGLLEKYHNIKVSKCEIQCNKTFWKGYWLLVIGYL